MDEDRSAPVRVRVVATVPLLRAGLERAARTAGLPLVEGDEVATIGLRSPDADSTHAAIEISVDAGCVTVVLAALPEQATWEQVWRLLGQLLDNDKA